MYDYRVRLLLTVAVATFTFPLALVAALLGAQVRVLGPALIRRMFLAAVRSRIMTVVRFNLGTL